jgi:membrane-associated protein
VHLGEIISSYGVLTYALLFAIIFVETGLVFVPFLPGDSLLFVAGAFAAVGSLNVFSLIVLLAIAAILGDTCNYWIGHFFGEHILASPRIPVSKSLLEKTRQFFARHGGKTIVMARFVPGVRTFAPFVAGAGSMGYGRFILYNIAGGILWVILVTVAGYFFGTVPIVKNNLTVFILGIIAVSFLPVLFSLLRRSRAPRARSAAAPRDSSYS